MGVRRSGNGLDNRRRGIAGGGPSDRPRALVAMILLTLAVAGCSPNSATPSLPPSGAARTTAPTPRVSEATVPGFGATGSMVSPSRGYHTATRLTDGRVLIVGGQTVTEGSVSYFSSAELYDPAVGTFRSTGSMSQARESHTATLLQDGRVLIVGGQNDNVLSSAELYDPLTGKFNPTGSMSAPRENHTATLLADGRVLIAGGDGAGSADQAPLLSAEIYDPKSGTFSQTGSMPVATFSIAAITMLDGRVFVAGADAESAGTAEVYDPTTGSFSSTGRMAAQAFDTAVLLHDGRVLAIGGHFPGAEGNGSADLYDPTTNSFGPAGTMTSPRFGQSATVLADGRVLVAGGAVDDSAEVYAPPPLGATITPSPGPALSPASGALEMGRGGAG